MVRNFRVVSCYFVDRFLVGQKNHYELNEIGSL